MTARTARALVLAQLDTRERPVIEALVVAGRPLAEAELVHLAWRHADHLRATRYRRAVRRLRRDGVLVADASGRLVIGEPDGWGRRITHDRLACVDSLDTLTTSQGSTAAPEASGSCEPKSVRQARIRGQDVSAPREVHPGVDDVPSPRRAPRLRFGPPRTAGKSGATSARAPRPVDDAESWPLRYFPGIGVRRLPPTASRMDAWRAPQPDFRTRPKRMPVRGVPRPRAMAADDVRRDAASTRDGFGSDPSLLSTEDAASRLSRRRRVRVRS